MNDQLQAQLAQILAQIMISVGEVKDFSMAQLPDVAQQYIKYGIWMSGISSVILLLVIIASIFFLRIGLKLLNRNEDAGIPLTLFSGVIALFSMVGFIHQLHSFILVMTAPKVWFILEIKNLLS